MARLSKTVKRAFRDATALCAQGVVAVTPRPIQIWAAPYARRAEMLFADHAILRLIYPNMHRLSPEAWRAAQPLPSQVHALARRGVRTIINLRGFTSISTYGFERAACEEAGINMIDFRVHSRAAPSREMIRNARELFDQIEYPMLMHCKSGADRAGLMSALYLHARQGVPIETARKQLSLKYGHIRQADTGVLDHFFEHYLAFAQHTPIAFFDWVESHYEPQAVAQGFAASGWANRIVNGVLKRE